MRKILTLALICFSVSAFAQTIEITPNYGYRVGSKLEVYSGVQMGYLKINDSQSFGIDLSYPVRANVAVNVSWQGQFTTADVYKYGYSNDQDHLGDVSVNYYMVSGIYSNPSNGITPFGGFGLGAATAKLTTLDSDVLVRFAASLQAGAKFDLSDKIGLRIRAEMLMPLQFGGGGFFCGIGTGGSGCSVSVGASSAIIQGDFSAGIVVKLGSKSGGAMPNTNPTW